MRLKQMFKETRYLGVGWAVELSATPAEFYSLLYEVDGSLKQHLKCHWGDKKNAYLVLIRLHFKSNVCRWFSY